MPNSIIRFALGAALALAVAESTADVEAQGTPDPAEISAACDDERHRDFDFWLGEWEVFAGDSLVGRNTIRRVAGGCGVLESWRATSGGTGTSVNFFDPSDGRWHQVWVGAGGSRLRLAGGLRDGAMVLEGERAGRDGGTVRDRITWTARAGGSVRQHWEVSTGGGEWRTVFDGLYRRP